MGTPEALDQEADIQIPRRKYGIAFTVDTTGRAIDLSTIPWNEAPFMTGFAEHLFLDLQNDGANPIYFYADTQGAVVDIDPTAITAAGTQPTQLSTVPKVLRANEDAPARIVRSTDKFLHVRSTGGTTTLRIFPSSKSSPQGR